MWLIKKKYMYFSQFKIVSLNIQSDYCLTPNEEFFSYSIERSNFIQWNGDDNVRFVLDQHANWIILVLAHWNNSPQVDMWLHSDTLFRFWPNQSLFIFFNAACLSEKKQIPISSILVWPNRDSTPRSTTFKACMQS